MSNWTREEVYAARDQVLRRRWQSNSLAEVTITLQCELNRIEKIMTKQHVVNEAAGVSEERSESEATPNLALWLAQAMSFLDRALHGEIGYPARDLVEKYKKEPWADLSAFPSDPANLPPEIELPEKTGGGSEPSFTPPQLDTPTGA